MKIFDSPAFADPPHEVRAAFAAGAEESFFNLPEWYDTVARHGMEPGWHLRLYAHDDAVLPAFVLASGPSREVRSGSTIYTIEHAILSAAADRAQSIRRMVAATAHNTPSADCFVLAGLDPGSPGFAGALAGFRDAGFVTKPYFGWNIWFEPIEGGDFEAYVAARPSSLKNTWKRKSASLAKTARVVFRTTDDLDVEAFIALYDDVYRRSWKVPEPFPDFMPALLRMAARMGALRFGILEADGVAIAAQFWIVWAGRAIIYKLAYDDKAGGFSPGTILTMHMVRHVLERDQPKEINFGRGDDDYKKLWMSACRERLGIEAANPRTPRGLLRCMRMTAAKARDALRRRPR